MIVARILYVGFAYSNNFLITQDAIKFKSNSCYIAVNQLHLFAK